MKILIKTLTALWPLCFHSLPVCACDPHKHPGRGCYSPCLAQGHPVPLFWASQLVNDRARPEAEMWQSVLGPVPSCRFDLVSQPTAPPSCPQCAPSARAQCCQQASMGSSLTADPLCFPCKNGRAGGGKKLLCPNRWGRKKQGQAGNFS